MEMHAIQSKQASMSSGCIVAHPEVGLSPAITSGLPVIHPKPRALECSDDWALAECIGDYALTETQQKLRTDCWKRVLLIVAKHAGTSDRVLPLSGSDACC